MNLDKVVYESLVIESIKMYGHSKNISKVLNEILKKYFGIGEKKRFFKETVRIYRKLTTEEIRKLRREGFLEATLYGSSS